MQKKVILTLLFLVFFNLAWSQSNLEILDPVDQSIITCQDGKINLAGHLPIGFLQTVKKITCDGRSIQVSSQNFKFINFQLRQPGINTITCSYSINGQNFSDSVSLEWKTNLKAPIAEFDSEEASPLSVKFDASSSVDIDGRIISYDWDFGDGSKGKGKRVNHTYALAGQYTVKLIVTDNEQLQGLKESILVFQEGNRNPTAKISNVNVNGSIPIDIDFDGQLSSNPEGGDLSYAWYIDDVGPFSSSVNMNHSFRVHGTYRIKLVVTNQLGLTGTDEVTINAFDTTPPILTTLPSAYVITWPNWTIYLYYTDISAIDISSVKLFINNQDYSSKIVFEPERFSYTVTDDVDFWDFIAKWVLSDIHNNTATVSKPYILN